MNALGKTKEECKTDCTNVYYSDWDYDAWIDCTDACERLENGDAGIIDILDWIAKNAPGIYNTIRGMRDRGMSEQEIRDYLRQQGYRPPGEKPTITKYLPGIMIVSFAFLGLMMIFLTKKK